MLFVHFYHCVVGLLHFKPAILFIFARRDKHLTSHYLVFRVVSCSGNQFILFHDQHIRSKTCEFIKKRPCNKKGLIAAVTHKEVELSKPCIELKQYTFTVKLRLVPAKLKTFLSGVNNIFGIASRGLSICMNKVKELTGRFRSASKI